MAQLRPKIVKLAKIIGGVTGITTRIDENAPEYYCMAGILTDEEADVAIAAGLRKERTAAYLARKVGKTVQEVQPLLDNLVYYGIFRRSRNETRGCSSSGYSVSCSDRRPRICAFTWSTASAIRCSARIV